MPNRATSLLRVGASGFYGLLNRQPSARQRRRAALGERIAELHAESRHTYGSRRVRAQLKAENEAVSRKTVAAIMRERGLRVKYQEKACHAPPTAGTAIGATLYSLIGGANRHGLDPFSQSRFQGQSMTD